MRGSTVAWSRKRWLFAALLGAVLAVLGTVFALNFVSAEKQIERSLSHRYGVGDPQFLRELGTLLGPAIVDGNRVDNYENGDQIFPAMLAAIRSAEHSVNFESYIYWSGAIGREFAEALSERARAGVKVHVLIDWAGSQDLDESLVQSMQAAGAEVRRYHPLRWYNLGRMNNRTHRKLLVVDGKVGFTGGVGIADPWAGNAQDAQHWRDSHYRLEGPAVAQMQAAFMDNWIKTTGKVLQGPEYFPALEPAGSTLGQVFTSSPSGGGDSMQLMYLLAITAAEHTIDLSAAYFVPDPLTRHALLQARARGVRIRIIVPGANTDVEVVRHASRADWGELLRAGIEIHEYQPAMFHCKMFLVDSQLASVGSTNFDNRSFRLNDEANLNVYDRAVVERLETVFEGDLRVSKPISYEQWRNRPRLEQVMEKVSSMLSSQL
jgi:cardiolipin synthase